MSAIAPRRGRAAIGYQGILDGTLQAIQSLAVIEATGELLHPPRTLSWRPHPNDVD
jgi:hypothetical protein